MRHIRPAAEPETTGFLDVQALMMCSQRCCASEFRFLDPTLCIINDGFSNGSKGREPLRQTQPI
jgi:hypothetical protein